eukprot:759202_1
MTSILPSFYWNFTFQSIATKSQFYYNDSVVENKTDVHKILESNDKYNMEETSTDENDDLELFIEPILVRNRRPSITCALYNSTTEVSKHIYEDY